MCPTDMAVTTMEAGIMVTVVAMAGGVEIGTTTRTGDTKIGAITVGRIAPEAGAVAAVGAASRSVRAREI